MNRKPIIDEEHATNLDQIDYHSATDRLIVFGRVMVGFNIAAVIALILIWVLR